MVSVPSCLSFTTRHEWSSLHLDESNLLPHEGMGCTNPTHPPPSAKERLTAESNDSTSSPAVTALAHCVYNLEHVYFSQDYNYLHYWTENALSWTFLHWNISNSPMIINMEVSKEFCNYHSEREHDVFDPSIQPSATTRMWCFREETDTVLPLLPTAY